MSLKILHMHTEDGTQVKKHWIPIKTYRHADAEAADHGSAQHSDPEILIPLASLSIISSSFNLSELFRTCGYGGEMSLPR